MCSRRRKIYETPFSNHEVVRHIMRGVAPRLGMPFSVNALTFVMAQVESH